MKATMNTRRRILITPFSTTQKESKSTVKMKNWTPNYTTTGQQHILIWVRSWQKTALRFQNWICVSSVVTSLGVTRYNNVSRSYTKGSPFFSKMVYKRVRGWTSGRSLPVYNFFEYPPPLSRGGKMLDASRGTQRIRQKILRWFPICFKNHFG